MGEAKGLQEIRGFRKSFVLLSVFYVIAGVVLLVWPAMSMELFCRVLGIGTLIVGVAHVLIYITKDHTIMNIMEMDLVVGVVCVAFGAFLLLHPEFVQEILPFAAGIMLLIGAIVKLQNAIDMRRLGFAHWQIMLIFFLVLLVMGAVLIYNPFQGHVLLVFIGAALIIDGSVNIAAMLALSFRMKKLAKAKAAKKTEPVPGPADSGGDEPVADAEAVEVPPANVPAVRKKQELETRK